MEPDGLNDNPPIQPGSEGSQNLSTPDSSVQPNPQVQSSPQTVASMPAAFNRFLNKKLIFIVLGLLIIFTVTVIGIKLAGSKKNPESVKQALLPTLVINSPIPSITEVITQPVNSPITANLECADLSEKLETCSKYECSFTHPITNEKMKREITGLSGDKCNFIEQMPNNGQMKCDYTLNTRMAVSSFIKNSVSAESSGTSVHVDLDPTGVSPTVIYTMNGKVVDNPLQEALNSGECVITDY